jgi:hypothetical protein
MEIGNDDRRGREMREGRMEEQGEENEKAWSLYVKEKERGGRKMEEKGKIGEGREREGGKSVVKSASLILEMDAP